MRKLVNVLMTLVLCCTIFLNGSLSVNATGASAEVDMEDFVAQGQELFEEFLEVSAFIESDSSWNDCLYVYNKVRRISGGQIYLESVGDASQEVWDSLSAYEVLVYYDTYLSFASMANAVNTVNYDSYVADEEHGVAEFVKIAVLGWNGNDSDKVIAAYEEFVEWQIEYYRIYNFPYNFITGKSYAEETHQDFGIENTESAEQGVDNEAEAVIEDITDDEVKEILNELTDEEKSEIAEEVEAYEASSLEEEEEPKSFVLPIVLVAVVVVGGIVVVVMQKKRK